MIITVIPEAKHQILRSRSKYKKLKEDLETMCVRCGFMIWARVMAEESPHSLPI